MALAIRPIRRRRRTAQRGKSLSQSQRWGKVVITMPVPQGIISTTTGPVDPSAPKIEEAIKEADAEEATEEYAPKKRAKKV